MTTDSLHNPLTDSLQTSLEVLFGASARLEAQPIEALQATSSLADNVVVWAGVVGLFVLYLFVMFAYGSHIPLMGKIIAGRNLGIRVADELSYLFMRAVRYSLVMGVIMWALVAIKWLDVVGVESVGIEEEWLLPLFVATGLGVSIVQRALTNGICRLVRRGDIAEGLDLLSDTLMSFVAIITTPVTLLFVANAGVSAQVLGVVCFVVAVLGLLTFCIKSLIFFVEQKVSILLLILYLCTVVLIPIGIVATLVVRNTAI